MKVNIKTFSDFVCEHFLVPFKFQRIWKIKSFRFDLTMITSCISCCTTLLRLRLASVVQKIRIGIVPYRSIGMVFYDIRYGIDIYFHYFCIVQKYHNTVLILYCTDQLVWYFVVYNTVSVFIFTVFVVLVLVTVLYFVKIRYTITYR